MKHNFRPQPNQNNHTTAPRKKDFFDSYCSNQVDDADLLFREDEQALQVVRGAGPPTHNKNRSVVVPQTRELADGIVKSKSTIDD